MYKTIASTPEVRTKIKYRAFALADDREPHGVWIISSHFNEPQSPLKMVSTDEVKIEQSMPDDYFLEHDDTASCEDLPGPFHILAYREELESLFAHIYPPAELEF
jgi:hypothetical protein